ncbi:hypothetical protein [Thalassorhabdomicrobium marinisediminis]|uniref:Uncharacterized protein n=1 Tax=Thalassorhabdomicrobium marinisediminis TaxID=2170577 RepID=A0A2T7G0K1_9RHOB|nr:hypothetical protein [Thalassorhabdomicrobium marinisediminis]PVA07952.1 hypothetical protein DC363_00160 [Thalassorhabdomicrobium marinisediminis]
MPDKPTKPDFYSGVPWVYVTVEQAHAHPKGRLNLLLWLIAAYFVATGLLKFALAWQYGAGLGVSLLSSIWPFLTGIGLALRVPWSVVMAAVSTGLTAFALVRGLGTGDSLLTLVEMLVNVGILFYLLDGDRPNLIYRHRYRKYSAAPPPADETA